MFTRATDWRLIAGIGLSLLAHAAVAAVLSMGPSDPYEESYAPADEPDPTPDIRPGVDRSDTTTINWIGFETPTPHEAPRATTDQPMLERSEQPELNEEASVPAPEATPDPIAQPAAPPIALPDVSDIDAAPPEAPGQAPLPPAPDPTDPEPASIDALLNHLELMRRMIEQARNRPSRAPAMNEPAPEVQPRDEAPPAPESEPAPASGGERESPPTAQRDPVTIKPGRPVAVEGVRINTVAPRFTIVTRVTAAPSNPLVRIALDGSGRVVSAEIVQSSGYANVDRPVLDAVYQWRASGERLEEMAAEDPELRFSLDFRIILR